MRVNEVTSATTSGLHKLQHYAVPFCPVLLYKIVNVRFPQQNIETHQGHSVPHGSEGLMRVRTKDPFSYLKSSALYKTENPHQARVFVYRQQRVKMTDNHPQREILLSKLQNTKDRTE